MSFSKALHDYSLYFFTIFFMRSRDEGGNPYPTNGEIDDNGVPVVPYNPTQEEIKSNKDKVFELLYSRDDKENK